MVNCFAASDVPFWWLETEFGVLVFVLVFLTWGLIIVTLVLHVLYLVRVLFSDGKVKKSVGIRKKKKKTKKT